MKGDLRQSGDGAKCFWPRHLLRVTQGADTFDHLICFTCSWYEVYHNGKMIRGLTHLEDESQTLLDQLLTDAGIELVPQDNWKQFYETLPE